VEPAIRVHLIGPAWSQRRGAIDYASCGVLPGNQPENAGSCAVR